MGKSTCAAAAALRLAEEREVLLLGTDPAGSLADVLDVPLTDGEAKLPGRLTVRQVRAAETFRAWRDAYRESAREAFAALGLERSAALDRRVVESLLDLAPPGMDEIFAVAALLDAPESDGPQAIVVDTAPTGHFLRLVATPGLGLEWTRQLLRVIRRYRAALGLDAFAERLLVLAKQLKRLDLSLRSPDRSAVIVVSQPGPLVGAETRRLLARLTASSVRVAAVVQNRCPDMAPEVDAPAGTPLLLAPALEAPPVGPAALSRFLDRWTLARPGTGG